VYARAKTTSPCGTAVSRARVHDEYLDVLFDALVPDCVEAAHEIGAAVLDRDQHRDHRGVAATTN
jgi:hypothetical protein